MGNTAGEVKFPEHMEKQHHEWLNDSTADPTTGDHLNVADEMYAVRRAGLTGQVSPYAGVASYDPDTDLFLLESNVDNFLALAEDVVPEIDIEGFASQSVSGILGAAGYDVIPDADETFTALTSRLTAYNSEVTGFAPDTEIGAAADAAIAKLASMTNPSTDLTAVQARFDDYKTYVEAITPTLSVDAAHAVAVGMLNDDLFSASNINAAVDAFDARTAGRHARNVSRAMSGLFDAGAVMTSQAGMVLAQMESDRAIEVNSYEQQLRLQHEQQKAELATRLTEQIMGVQQYVVTARQTLATVQLAIDELDNRLDREDAARDHATTLQLTGRIADLEQVKVAAQQALSAMQVEAHRLRHQVDQQNIGRHSDAALMLTSEMIRYQIMRGQMLSEADRNKMEFFKLQSVALNDQINQDLTFELRDVLWDLDLFEYGNKMMGSMSGVAAFKERSEFERRMMIGSLVLGGVGSITSVLGAML